MILISDPKTEAISEILFTGCQRMGKNLVIEMHLTGLSIPTQHRLLEKQSYSKQRSAEVSQHSNGLKLR